MLHPNHDDRVRPFKWAIGILFLAVIFLLYLLLRNTGSSFNATTGRADTLTTDLIKTSIQYDSAVMFLPGGECRSNKPAEGEFVKLTVTLKSKTATLPIFDWNGINYSHSRGCFKNNAEGVSMAGFISHADTTSQVFFHAEVKSRVYNDEFEFSVKVHDKDGQLIGKYPETGDAEKKKIVNIKYPATIDGLIKFKNPIARL